MTQWLAPFLALPDVAQTVLLGAAGGLIGIGLAGLAGRFTTSRLVGAELIILPVIALPALFNTVVGRALGDGVVDRVMADMSAAPLNAAVLASDPALAPALRQKLGATWRAGRQEAQVTAQARGLLAGLATEKFNALAPDASDAAILAYQKLSLEALGQLAGRPGPCVAFVLGKPGFDAGLLDARLSEAVMAQKARIIREGAAKTAPFRTPLSPEDLTQSLAIGYRMTGRNATSLDRLSTLDADPAAGCAAATDYMTALSVLEAKRAARVFKTLLLQRAP